MGSLLLALRWQAAFSQQLCPDVYIFMFVRKIFVHKIVYLAWARNGLSDFDETWQVEPRAVESEFKNLGFYRFLKENVNSLKSSNFRFLGFYFCVI